MSTDWVAQYVGIPFKWNGYDRDGCSCWGLVRLVLAEQFNVFLPRHDDAIAVVRGGSTVPEGVWYQGTLTEPVDPRSARMAGDVVRMLTRVGPSRILPLHVGVMVDPWRVLHVRQATLSIVQDTRDAEVAKQIKGVYRLV